MTNPEAPYDRGEELAYKAGEEHELDPGTRCFGCHTRICDPDACNMCEHNPDPDPQFEALRLIDAMVSELLVIRQAEVFRIESDDTVLDEWYCRQTDKASTILNDGIERLLTIMSPPKPPDLDKLIGSMPDLDAEGLNKMVDELRHPERKGEEALVAIAKIVRKWKNSRYNDTHTTFFSIVEIQKALELSGVHGVEEILKGGGQ